MNPQAPRLRAALHWRIEPPFAPELAWDERVRLAGRVLGTQCAQACERAGFAPELLLLNSTMLSLALTMPGPAARRFDAAIADACGLRPAAMLNAYQCAGWGFALRHAAFHRGLRRVAIAIIDLDLHDMAWQRRHPVIGDCGFGVTTLLFETGRSPHCSGPHANSAFNELLMATRARQQAQGACPTFLPFVRGPLAATATRLLARDSLAPNRYDALGHCFGADPWIGVIERYRDDPQEARLLAGAIAYNGYFTLSDVALDASAALGFEPLAGDAASLGRLPPAAPRARPDHHLNPALS
jgi:hypothetical protein